MPQSCSLPPAEKLVLHRLGFVNLWWSGTIGIAESDHILRKCNAACKGLVYGQFLHQHVRELLPRQPLASAVQAIVAEQAFDRTAYP